MACQGPNLHPRFYAATIKADFDSWCHIEQSVWLVDTSLGASEVRDHMKSALKSKDVLFVASLQGNWGSFNFGEKRNEWLQNRVF
jgi:prenyltransferase beta subunit